MRTHAHKHARICTASGIRVTWLQTPASPFTAPSPEPRTPTRHRQRQSDARQVVGTCGTVITQALDDLKLSVSTSGRN